MTPHEKLYKTKFKKNGLSTIGKKKKKKVKTLDIVS